MLAGKVAYDEVNATDSSRTFRPQGDTQVKNTRTKNTADLTNFLESDRTTGTYRQNMTNLCQTHVVVNDETAIKGDESSL